MTRLLAVPLDASDVFLMTFMILQDSYMEPTRVGSNSTHLIHATHNLIMSSYSYSFDLDHGKPAALDLSVVSPLNANILKRSG